MNDWPLVSQALVHRIGWTLVHSTWQGSLIAATLALTLRLLRNAAATKRYAACGLAIALTIFAAIATFYLCSESVRASAPQVIAIQQHLPVDSSLIATPPSAPPVVAPIHPPRRDVLQILVVLWAIGVAAMAVRHLGGWLWLLRLRRGKPIARYQPAVDRLAERLGIDRVIRLLETSRLDVPAVIGFFRPVILIPLGVLNDLTPQQIEAILAHELAHVRRHDYLVNLLQAAVETLLFYHPAVWWMSNRMRAERENCCDDIAADLCGDKRTYAAALAALESRRGSTLKLAAAATGGELLARVRRLLQSASPAPRGYARSVAIISLVILILAGAVVGWSLLRSPREHTVDLAKSDKNKTDKPTVEVLVGAESLLYEGAPLDWKQIEARIAAIPAERRHQTVIGVAASSGSVPIQRYFDATNHLSELATKYGLAYVSQTGIKPTTNPSADLPPGTEVGEYYMDGHVRRSGVYSLTGKKITLRQALIAAGGVEAGFEKSFLDVIRRDHDTESLAAAYNSVDDVTSGRAQPVFLKPYDVVHVGKTPTTLPVPEQAIVGPPPDLSQGGEYYMDGYVRRTGVYSMTGRKITLKQAIAAAGGVEDDPASLSITIIRRTGADKSSIPLEHASVANLMEGRIPDMYLWPNDVIRIGPVIPPATTQTATTRAASAVSPAASPDSDATSLLQRVRTLAATKPSAPPNFRSFFESQIIGGGRSETLGTPDFLRQPPAAFENATVPARALGAVGNQNIAPATNPAAAAPALQPEQSREISRASAIPVQSPPATRPFTLGAVPALPTVINTPAVAGPFEQGTWAVTVGIRDNDVGARNRSWDFFDARSTAAAATQSLTPTVGQIARADATMRDYLLQRDELAIQLAEAKLHAGNDQAKFREKTAALDAMDRRIKEYAEAYRGSAVPSATQPATTTPLN